MKQANRRYGSSLSLRVIVTAVVASVCSTAGLALILFSVVESTMREDFDRELGQDAQLLTDLLEWERGGELEIEVAPLIAIFERRRDAETWWRISDGLGRRVAGEHEDLPFLRVQVGPQARELRSAGHEGVPLRIISYAFSARAEDRPQRRAGPPLHLVVARDTERLEATLGALRLRFWLAGTLSCFLITFLVVWQVRRGFVPLGAASRELQRWNVEVLDKRLAIAEVPNEVKPFVHRLNELLDRVERGVAREREFTGHVAHELRTPLTALRSGVEVTKRAHRDQADIVDRCDDLLETVDEMSDLVENLLTLARVDRDRWSSNEEPIELRPMVDRIWSTIAPVAERRGLRFINLIPGDFELCNDPGKLRIVLRNLLANAACYTEVSGQIEAGTDGRGFWVWDSGPALSEQQRARIFDRFWRADEARSGAGAHAGIGLSLVRGVCLSMGWQVDFGDDARGGLRFDVGPAKPAKAKGPEASPDPPTTARAPGNLRPRLALAVMSTGLVIGTFALHPTAPAQQTPQAMGHWLGSTTLAFVRPHSASRVAIDGPDLRPQAAAPLDSTRNSPVTQREEDVLDVTRNNSAPLYVQPGVRIRRESTSVAGQNAQGAPGKRHQPPALHAHHATAPLTLVGPAPSTKQNRKRHRVQPQQAASSVAGMVRARTSGPGSAPPPPTAGRSTTPRGDRYSQIIEEAPDDCDEQTPAEGQRIGDQACALGQSFHIDGDSTYFPIGPVGRRWIYEGEDEDEQIRLVVSVLAETRAISGIETRVLQTQEFVDGQLEERSLHFYAINEDGDLCLFGEEPTVWDEAGNEFTPGRWYASDPGAQPGLRMPADPVVGTHFQIERVQQHALDHANVFSAGTELLVPAFGPQNRTISMSEWSPLEPCETSVKHYVADVGLVIDEELTLLEDSRAEGL